MEKFFSRVPSIFNIVVFSIHGYFGQEKVLGLPDTGGQVVYILDQVRALEEELLQRIKHQGLSVTPKILVVKFITSWSWPFMIHTCSLHIHQDVLMVDNVPAANKTDTRCQGHKMQRGARASWKHKTFQHTSRAIQDWRRQGFAPVGVPVWHLPLPREICPGLPAISSYTYAGMYYLNNCSAHLQFKKNCSAHHNHFRILVPKFLTFWRASRTWSSAITPMATWWRPLCQASSESLRWEHGSSIRVSQDYLCYQRKFVMTQKMFLLTGDYCTRSGEDQVWRFRCQVERSGPEVSLLLPIHCWYDCHEH